MVVFSKKEPILLFLGDIALFVAALWLTLTVRYFELPSTTLLYDHIVPFSILFALWALIFFIAGLYDKHTVIFKRKLPTIILNTQLVNVSIAALFFFFVPYFGIAPKTNLIIYLLISFPLILLWRLVIFPMLGVRKKQKAILIGHGKEMKDLETEINNNPRYGLEFVLTIDLAKVTNLNDIQKEVLVRIGPEEASIIVSNTRNEKMEALLPLLYNLTFLQIKFQFIDINQLYEDVFDRIPLSSLQREWFLENISSTSAGVYDIMKRTIDVVAALTMGVVTAIIYPLVYVVYKFEGDGPVCIAQKRIGKYNESITAYKFRSMTQNEDGVWIGESKNEVTRIGRVLRSTSLDEFPQFWNILKGEMSLIGPRNDVSGLGSRLAEAIPHYNMRYLVKPGLSGWAQIKQDYSKGNISPQSVEETKIRLSYDLYYIKNKSFLLDIVIALRTIQTLISRLLP